MSENRLNLSIRHILVVADASSLSANVLETAVDLADQLDAEVICLYIEDVNLLRIAEFPFSQEVGSFSATLRQLQAERLERQLRTQASQLRQMLAGLAERKGVRWSFRVARGAIPAELLKAALETDMIILGKSGLTSWGNQHLETTTLTSFFRTSQFTLVVTSSQTHRRARQSAGAPNHGAILAAYDDSPAAQKALAAAVRLAQKSRRPLVVVLVSDDFNQVPQLQNQVDAWLQWHGLSARYRWLVAANPTELVHLATIENGKTLILPSEMLALADEEMLVLFQQINCPVLLVR